MASKRNKKYTMRAISPKFSEKGGFTAQFTGDGYSIDAFGEILPDVIERNGIKVSEGVARDLISKFLQACANKTAATGKGQSLTVMGIGIPAIAVMTSTKVDADNSGADANTPTQTIPVSVTEQ